MTTPAAVKSSPVKPGIEVLFEKKFDLLRGRNVGLITNPTGVDSQLNSSVELFRSQPGVKLAALYGPEHGVRGNAQAGEYVPFYFDEKFQLPVFSLYGQSMKPPADMLMNIDEYMRQYDTQSTGKVPEAGMLQAVDAMVFDLQDVGTRIYTYVATMAYAMQACAESGIDFIVLDRPNPINGVAMEGAVLDFPRHSSFIGLYPVPLRHGLTVGELALLFNEKFLPKKARLTVVPMENWTRDSWFDQSSLPWVMPSPNLPTLDTATVYPGQVLLEGTNLSEGRGTTRPFEIFGAPWIDGFVLACELNALKLPGVKFCERWFSPSFSKHRETFCGGCQMHVTAREDFRSVTATLSILETVKKLYGDRLEFHADYFDKVAGVSAVREALEKGRTAKNIVDGFNHDLEAFATLSRPFWLYR